MKSMCERSIKHHWAITSAVLTNVMILQIVDVATTERYIYNIIYQKIDITSLSKHRFVYCIHICRMVAICKLYLQNSYHMIIEGTINFITKSIFIWQIQFYVKILSSCYSTLCSVISVLFLLHLFTALNCHYNITR